MDTQTLTLPASFPMTMTSNSKTAVPSYFPGRQWQQVLERDPSADGQFFYAVKSTKIYCKPSCASRKPARKQVSFFPTAAAAEAAGFRACKRCEPDRVAPKADPQAQAITAVTDYLTTHADERTRLADVAKATGVGRLTILRGFKRVLGVSPGEFAKAQRLEKFKDKVRVPRTNVPNAPLAKSEATKSTAKPTPKPVKITDAIYESGFGSSSRLYEKSNASLGMTPRVMRAGGAGLLIRYTIAPSPLGRMLVATTDVGICSIAFGKDDAELVANLRELFNKAQLVPAKGNTGWLAEAVAYVVSNLSEHPIAAKFPLDVRATAFQQRVWKALQQIPRGETRSYGDLALELGVPKAARAVGAAIGANPVAVIVPCHRVIGKDGTLTGYRWGVDRKRKLLDAERR
ncbi:methylated-DNA--[protein]-cysteine S-methyltransferase [Granulicella sp. dw_53]|uniref:bifunctional transcriptional activator/DNA repair enzyme AdaA n=1 Tax=Granulicella sp. dw_53 TaxID=2719792 RepID=UPI0023DF76CB|nr:methylated-DNA--[protein]-cysteine S-methyltransferase [Granulicella sp. dw_53]